MNLYRKQHYVPKFIVKNFTYNGKKTNIYNKENNSFSKEYKEDAFQIQHFYRVSEEDNHIEIDMGKTIEDQAANIINHKILNKSEVILDRVDLECLKKFTLLQLLRTNSTRDKFTYAAGIISERKESETEREQWLRYLDLILDNSIKELRNSNMPKMISFFASLLYSSTYFVFVKPSINIEFTLPDNGIVKEPASLRSFFIFPVAPQLAIMLVDTVYKSILKEESVIDVLRNKDDKIYPISIAAIGLLNHFDKKTISDISRVTVPLVYFESNRNNYIKSYSQDICNSDEIISYFLENTLIHGDNHRLKKIYDRFLSRKDIISTYPVYFKNKVQSVLRLLDIYFTVGINEANNHFLLNRIQLLPNTSQLIFDDADEFIYQVHTLNEKTSIYLSYLLIEESYSANAYKDSSKLVYSFLQEKFWKKRRFPIPKIFALRTHLKKTHGELWEESLRNYRNIFGK